MDPMSHVGLTALALTASLFWPPSAPAAQEPSGPRPAQPARPLELPAFQPAIADTGIFSPPPFPPANALRRADGAPGREDWQQRADYTIKVVLDTAEQRNSGTATIRYTNNSPDTLRFVWLQLDQNLFRPGSIGSLLFAPESRFGAAGFKGGFEIERVTQCVDTAGPPRRKTRARRSPAAPPRCP